MSDRSCDVTVHFFLLFFLFFCETVCRLRKSPGGRAGENATTQQRKGWGGGVGRRRKEGRKEGKGGDGSMTMSEEKTYRESHMQKNISRLMLIISSSKVRSILPTSLLLRNALYCRKEEPTTLRTTDSVARFLPNGTKILFLLNVRHSGCLLKTSHLPNSLRIKKSLHLATPDHA